MYILTLEKAASSPEQKQLTFVYQVGEHVLGRGSELQCTSKKVSRKHALLKVTEDDGVFLESTHNNPCYHQLNNTQNIQIVSFSKSIKLNNGDKISLALEHGWFTAKISRSDNEDVLPSDTKKNKRELDGNEASEAKKIKLNDDVLTDIPELQAEMTVDINAVETEENAVEEATNNAVEETANNETEVTVKNEPLDITENSENINSNTEIKQERLDESTNEPEVKQEPVGTAVKDEPENNDKQDKCGINSNNPSSASTSLGNGSRRDRCWYGSSCYRKNPTHRATFCHPNDADYDSDPNDTRAICCYGINCYRRNKLHRQKYRHPGQDKIPDPPSKKKRKQQKSPKTNKTRKTKTVEYYDDEEDDYDLDDPFINDGDSSDEYEPESSDTESDEEVSSQSQNTEELEDTKQLLKDARKFTRRK